MNKSSNRLNIYFLAFFVLVSLGHLALVILKIRMYGYILSYDSEKYLHVAAEILGKVPIDVAYNCHTTPGYPIFLAFLNLASLNTPGSIAVAQAMLFCFSLYYLLTRLVSTNFLTYKAAGFASAIILVSVDAIDMNGKLLTESLVGSLLFSIAGLVLVNPLSNGKLFLLSLLIAFLTIVRFEYIVVLPIVIFLVNRDGWKISYMLTPLLITGIIVVFNGYRNEYIFNKFIVSGFGGSVIYGGNNPNGDGSWHKYYTDTNYLPEEYRKKMQIIDSQGECVACPGRDSLFKSLAKQTWLNDPIGQMRLTPLKFAKLWVLPAEFDPYTSDTEYRKNLHLIKYFKNENSFLRNIYENKYILIYWFFIALGVGGFIYKIISRGISIFDLYTILTILMLSVLYAIPFYGLPRFHAPLVPLLLIYSAFFFELIISKIAAFKSSTEQKRKSTAI